MILIIIQQIPLMFVSGLTLLPKAQQTTHLILLFGWLFLIVTIGITAGMWHFYQKSKTIRYGQPFTKQTWWTILLGFIAMILINNATLPFMRTTGNVNVDAITSVFETIGIFMLPYTLFLGPIMEELLYRGFLMNWFFPSSPVITIGLSAFLFGLVHGTTDPIYFISKALLGLILAIVYYHTRNIKSSIALHMLNNISAGLTIF
ncbi:CPBP family intramembrane metalloprotease [Latilactobacillus graminis]|uniref:CPBP family intramembrane metalloprotease n=1 Tax=Latilactobacillus graminis TaxID=60519 RepID=A0ABX6C9Q0_9LACO|nr:CPBP family intramembrane metalloprotease [Latilactobacillus graminis]